MIALVSVVVVTNTWTRRPGAATMAAIAEVVVLIAVMVARPRPVAVARSVLVVHGWSLPTRRPSNEG